ncbi:serine/arginine repetitive matrix protein 2 [Stegostoma tigrinum]|uniref:serine/arginine repetitive matrix protein 2 n=1 Tax=Stegostoma tigrinum TaxID=3053191 RepID=UPI00202B422E|nr:serine/arginine repetitive matrix protein 2 [Stegostoma tigrinum]XP_048377573.1 serine/arginine repetitive matrix protein 2 [Stegostoma tigrinum]XP_048377576.1 serine/arginine repetitive matrix protein 2 [Stegostoma tigrinum]XP_048377577.1 serine/arginine repetitive matrix protein 2 [Stegostoma tigrinum]
MEDDENRDPQQNECSGDESELDQCTESYRERGAEQVQLILQPLGRNPLDKWTECNTSTRANCSTPPCVQQVKNTLQHLRDLNAATRQPNDCGKSCQRDSRKQKQIRRRKTCTPTGSNAVTRSSPEIAVAGLHSTTGNGNPEKEVVSVLLSHLTSALQHIGSTYGATFRTRLNPEPEPAADMGTSYLSRLESESTEATSALQEDGISSLGIRVVHHPGFTLKKDRAWRYKKSVSASLPSSSQRVPFHNILGETLPYRDCLCSGGMSGIRDYATPSVESHDVKKTNKGLHLLDRYVLSPASLELLRPGLLRNMSSLEETETLGISRMRNTELRTEIDSQPVTKDVRTPVFSPDKDLGMKRKLDLLDMELSCLSQRSSGLGEIANPNTDQKSSDSPLKRLVGDSQRSQCSEGAYWGLVLGNGSGISNGRQRPLNGGGCSNSGNQSSSSSVSQTCPEKAESSSVPCQQNITNRITCSDSRLGPDTYDPFSPTDEENVNGEFMGGDFSPKDRIELDDGEEEAEEEEEDEEKYDPFDPTGSIASSNNLSPLGDDSEGELKIVSDAGLTEEEDCESPEYEEDQSPESTTCALSDVELQIDCGNVVKSSLEPELYSSPEYRDLESELRTGFAEGLSCAIKNEFESDSKLQINVQLDSVSQQEIESIDSENDIQSQNELAREATSDAMFEDEEPLLSPVGIDYSLMQSPDSSLQIENETLKLSLKSTQKEVLVRSLQEGDLWKNEHTKEQGLEAKTISGPLETAKQETDADSLGAPRYQKNTERTISEPVESLESQNRLKAKSGSSSRVTSKSASRQRSRTEVVRKDKSDSKVHSKAEHKSKSASASRYHHKSHRTVERKDNLVFTVNVSKWPEDARKYEDSEIEEGEIVQQDEENFSPARTFRSRGRIFERLRGVEGDDFISLHADSDEGALQIDLGENSADGGRKKVDQRRKVTNQQRERFVKQSRSPAESKTQSGSHSESSSRSRKKHKREHKKARSKDRKRSRSHSRERKRSSSRNRLRIHRKKSRSRSRSWERRRSNSRSRHKVSRSRTRSREHRRSRSWSPSNSTSVSAIGSLRASAERWKSRVHQSKESGSFHRSRSSSKSRKERRKKEKHREPEAVKRRRQSRSRSKERSQREKRALSPSPRRSKERSEKEKDRSRERNPPSEKKHEKTAKGRRDSRIVVPPSIQELNNDDILIKARSITRTITVNPGESLEDQEDPMEVAALSPNREAMYDSDELGFENSFSDVEAGDHVPESRVPGKGQGSKNERRSSHEKSHRTGDTGTKLLKVKDRKRAHADEKSGKEKRRKKLTDGQKGTTGSDSLKAEKKGKEHLIGGQSGKKIKSVPKESKQVPRKVKLQSKVAVLIRDGVSCAASMKDDRGKGGGLIGVKFSRDKESRSPFMKTEDQIHDSKPGRHRVDSSESKGVASRAPKGKAVTKPRSTAKKTKTAGTKVKGSGKKKKEAKPKTALKKAATDSGSSSSSKESSPFRIKEELSWSSSEKSDDKVNLPSPTKDTVEQGLSPLSQISESAPQPLEAAFTPKEPAAHPPPPPPPPQQQKDYHEHSDTSKVNGDKPRAPSKPLSWDLQTGGGMLALTALLFKMEEANRAKAQDSIQAITQILSQTKPPVPPVSTSLSSHLPASQPAPRFLRQGSLSMLGCSAGLPTLSVSTVQPPTTSSAKLYSTLESTEPSKVEGTASTDSNMDSDRYLKKLHTQERAVEEVKLAIKPFYQKKEINKDDYKDILRKAVHKICHSKSGEINPVKVANLVKAYVEKYKYARRHSKRPEEGGRQSNGKEAGKLDKHGKAAAQT